MTKIYITIDTEYSFAFAREAYAKAENGGGQAHNYAHSIACETPEGSVGIQYQMDVFDRYGLTGVFFVDPMPALIWGVEAIRQVVEPIVARGHDVQLHLHSEWLDLAGDANPLGDKTGRNIRDFSEEEQYILLSYAKDILMASGAPEPVAFRAGNYGANDDTLRALARLGITYDTSHCPGMVVSECGISLGRKDRAPLNYMGVTQVPIGCIQARNNTLRHAQLTALSTTEMIAAIQHARDTEQDSFTFVSHSFEITSRDRMRTNHIVKRRFENLCKALAQMPGIATAGYHNHPPVVIQKAQAPILPHSYMRTAPRMAEQLVANYLYGRG